MARTFMERVYLCAKWCLCSALIIKVLFLGFFITFFALPEIIFQLFDPTHGVVAEAKLEGDLFLEIAKWPYGSNVIGQISSLNPFKKKEANVAQLLNRFGQELHTESEIVSGRIPVLSLVGDKNTEQRLRALCPVFKQARLEAFKGDIEQFLAAHQNGKVAVVAHNSAGEYVLQLPRQSANIAASDFQQLAAKYNCKIISLSCDSNKLAHFGIDGAYRSTELVERLERAQMAKSFPEIAAHLGIDPVKLKPLESKFKTRIRTPSTAGRIFRVFGSAVFCTDVLKDAWNRHKETKDHYEHLWTGEYSAASGLPDPQDLYPKRVLPAPLTNSKAEPGRKRSDAPDSDGMWDKE